MAEIARNNDEEVIHGIKTARPIVVWSLIHAPIAKETALSMAGSYLYPQLDFSHSGNPQQWTNIT
jgi:hypothetical protein